MREHVDQTRARMDQLIADASREVAQPAGGQTLIADLDARIRLLDNLIGRADAATSRLNQAIERADRAVERSRTVTMEAEARLSSLLDALLIDLRRIGDSLEFD